MGCKYAEHARWLYRSSLVMSSFSSHTEGNPRPGPTQQRVCVCGRCGCVWLSELLDFQHVELQVWKLGVRFMCDKLPTCGLIGATPPFSPFPFSSFQRGENAPFPQLVWILRSVNIERFKVSNFSLSSGAHFCLCTAWTSSVVLFYWLLSKKLRTLEKMGHFRHLGRFIRGITKIYHNLCIHSSHLSSIY